MKTSHDSEVPAHGQQVITACAFIHHHFDGVQKVFLPKRAATKKFLPGMFELPGGHIDYGENITEGLKREIMEEHQMEIEVGDSFSVFDYINEVKGSHSVQVNYFAQFIGDIDDITINPEDHSEFDWFTAEDVVRRREEIVPNIVVPHAYADDPEYLAIIRGFELLEGGARTY